MEASLSLPLAWHHLHNANDEMHPDGEVHPDGTCSSCIQPKQSQHNVRDKLFRLFCDWCLSTHLQPFLSDTAASPFDIHPPWILLPWMQSWRLQDGA